MHKINFHLDLLEKDNLSLYFSELFNLETNTIVHHSNKENPTLFQNNTVYIDDVPNYFDSKLNTTSKDIKLKKVDTYNGSLINLSQFNTIDDYLLKEIKTKERSEIRRRQKRLDTCIKPVYKMYYGDISKSDYDIIFNDYRQMLIRRLEQKNSYWEELDYWKERYESTLKLINEKKACIFVIYDDKKPIAIYINSIFGTIIFNEVVAYDINYSRFNIGILIFIKIIEWSINNNFDLMDMSKGDFSYKERFRNRTYTFQNHIVFNKKNTLNYIKAHILIFKFNMIYKLLPLLKKIKIDKLNTAYKRIKKKHYFKSQITTTAANIKVEKISEIDSTNDLELINLKNEDYLILKKPLIDFSFLNVEFINDVLVYKDLSNTDVFYFKGKKTIQKIVLK